MKNLLGYLKNYKKETILAPLFKLLEASFELLVPLVMASVIDRGIGGNQTDYIVKMCLVLVFLGVVGLACSITAQYFAAKAAVGFAARLRHALFEHIQSLSFSGIDTIGTSTLITRMTNDVNQVQSGMNLALRLLLRSPFVVFGSVEMAFTVNPKAALIFAVTVPLLMVLVFGIMLVNIPMYKKVQAKLDGVLSLTRENLTGVRVIRAFHREEEEIRDFSGRNQELTGIQLFAGRVSALMNPLTYVVVNGAVVLLLRRGARQVYEGGLTQGELVALVNYMTQILVELIKMASLIISITKAIASGNRIQGILEIPSGPDRDGDKSREDLACTEGIGAGQTDAGTPKIIFDHVGLTYHEGGEEALSDLTFSIEKGQTVGIIGGTGSGKTSLVHLIPRFYDVTRGRVLVDGVDVRACAPEELRRKVGIVMQKAVLFQGSIRENLLWGDPDADRAVLEQALEASQSMEFVREKEGGMDFQVSQGGKNLSGGQRQRLSIARALTRRPEILILDDSASALDFATESRLRRAIRELGDETTVLIVSQRISSIQHADQIIVLDDGQAVGIGTHEQLLADCQVYREIFETQVSGREAGGVRGDKEVSE